MNTNSISIIDSLRKIGYEKHMDIFEILQWFDSIGYRGFVENKVGGEFGIAIYVKTGDVGLPWKRQSGYFTLGFSNRIDANLRLIIELLKLIENKNTENENIKN